jgi:hypothetical protein
LGEGEGLGEVGRYFVPNFRIIEGEHEKDREEEREGSREASEVEGARETGTRCKEVVVARQGGDNYQHDRGAEERYDGKGLRDGEWESVRHGQK